jgi:hypothetical protein
VVVVFSRMAEGGGLRAIHLDLVVIEKRRTLAALYSEFSPPGSYLITVKSLCFDIIRMYKDIRAQGFTSSSFAYPCSMSELVYVLADVNDAA